MDLESKKGQKDPIIIDECSTIGGNTVLSSALKILVRRSVTKKVYIVMKSYLIPKEQYNCFEFNKFLKKIKIKIVITKLQKIFKFYS